MSLHLRPTAEIATRALLPGDPGRAMALAQDLLENPLMSNHHRGLWGYTGVCKQDGEPLTIQSTGMGGPSAAIVLTELIGFGVRRAVRVGTCGALADELRLGDLVIAPDALTGDGTSRALNGHADRAQAHAALYAALHTELEPHAHAGTVASTDLFYSDHDEDWTARGAIAVEMEAATLFALGAERSVEIACGLVVSDVFPSRGQRSRIDDGPLLEASLRLARGAVRALSH